MKVNIPISKSCYARIATICAIAGIAIPYSDENDDIIAMREALQTAGNRIYVGSSGTAARFAIAYYSSMDCDIIVDGSEQLQKRPISSILDAARQLGAIVEGNSLPVRLKGRFWNNDRVVVDASQSSQTVSALMLAGMRNGLAIETQGDRNSWSYVELTASIMRRCGIPVAITDNEVRIPKMDVINLDGLKIEKDWSSAVFWYGYCATRGEEILIPGLSGNSAQPDQAAMDIFSRLGVVTTESPDGIILSHRSLQNLADVFQIDCRRTPDLAMILIPTLCRLGRNFTITGLDTLDRKESKRGEALCAELRKSGYVVTWTGNSITYHKTTCEPSGEPETYDDHRMVMAHLILGNNPDLTPLDKSYPGLKYFFAKKFGG